MIKIDARKISAVEQQNKRNKAIELKKNGIHYLEIAKKLGVHPNTISNWWSKYNKEDNIVMKKRGRRVGSKRIIDTKEIIKQIIHETPKSLNIPGDELWTRKAIREMIGNDSDSAVYNYLNHWKFSAKFPSMSNFINNNNEEEEEKYQKIVEDCEDEKGEMHWLEKKSYVIEHDENNIDINMIYSVSKKTKLQFMLHEETFNDLILIEFLNRLIMSTDNKICLILNNLNVDTKIVNDWVKEHQAKIVLCHFAKYKTSPVAKTNSKTPRSPTKNQSQPTLF